MFQAILFNCVSSLSLGSSVNTSKRGLATEKESVSFFAYYLNKSVNLILQESSVASLRNKEVNRQPQELAAN